MVSILRTIPSCWQTAKTVSRLGLPLLTRVGMADTACSPTDEKKLKILVTRPDYPANGMELLEKKFDLEILSKGKATASKEDIIQGIKGKSAIFCCLNDKIDKDVLKAAGPSLRVVSTMSVGVEHIDIDECRKLSIKVGYTPYVLTEATAELTIALLLATSRRLFEAHSQLRTGGWTSWAPVWMCGPALKGSTVGLVGFGRVGQEVARKVKAFNVAKILYTDSGKKPKNEVATELGAQRVELEELLKTADFVIAICSLNPKTQGMFSAQRFSLMKPTAIFINTGRGGLVDHDALYAALKNNKLWAAGLDVMTPEPLPTNHPLLELPNCVLLPHIGSATYQSRMTMCELTAKNIIAVLEDRTMPAEYI
ncbi:glyoxylate reductase/hydroxypyruvate reductase [Homalodisca vitripennis]|nr:glyoxylate reductase/hydroxypyruvate reductase [Homalodisca vitripennis]XP_046673808.1 glyoxylate reductase/hydroxypyruvate reductase [Homalodisca vitripennis]XP_046673809.1 glyoxylate reductase/hydroxypyruvate reductase [Homalodisca vitripennis]